MHVLWHCSQMNWIQTPVCSTFLWICNAAKKCQSAISRLLHSSGDLAGCLFSVKSSEVFTQGWVNPSDSLWMQAHANVLLPQSFWQVMFCFGQDGCPLHRTNQGTWLWNMSSEPWSTVEDMEMRSKSAAGWTERKSLTSERNCSSFDNQAADHVTQRERMSHNEIANLGGVTKSFSTSRAH